MFIRPRKAERNVSVVPIVRLAVRKMADAATVRAVILQKINNDVLKKT